MSTSAFIPDQDVKHTSVEYTAYQVTEEIKDKKTGETSTRLTPKATMQETAIAKAKEDGTVLYSQSFSFDLPGTVAGFSKLGIPDEELVNLLQQAIKAKAGRIITSLMTEQDDSGALVFQPQEGFYDIRGLLSEVGGRRGLSPEEKAVKVLSGLNLSADVMALVMAQINASKAAATAAS